MNVGLALALGAALATQAAAGSSFRLEVGSPIAAGTSAKLKDSKRTVVVVRPMVCDDVPGVRITGTAEGIVDGRRQSVPLRLTALPTPGVHAVQREWPEGGQWILHLTGTCPSPKATASTIVPLTKTSFDRANTQVLRDLATKAQVEAALAAHSRSQS